MANFYVTHNKFPRNPQLFTINLRKVAGIPAEVNPNFTPTFGIAEEFWKLFIYTTGLNSSGNNIQPIVLDVIGSYETVNDLVNGKLANLCSLIDWSQQGQYDPESDLAAPLVVDQYPARGQTGVPITSAIVIRIQDPLPANGIDISTLSFNVDGFDINPNVYGNKFDYTITFSPKPIFYDY